jgi:hypothetical protein
MAHNALSSTRLKIETNAVASSCVGVVQPGLDFKYVTAAINFSMPELCDPVQISFSSSKQLFGRFPFFRMACH